jgi:hypothetical protein
MFIYVLLLSVMIDNAMISSCIKYTAHFVPNKVFRLVVPYFPRNGFYSRVYVTNKYKYRTYIFHNPCPVTYSLKRCLLRICMPENVTEN